MLVWEPLPNIVHKHSEVLAARASGHDQSILTGGVEPIADIRPDGK